MADEQDREYVKVAEDTVSVLFDKYANAKPAEKLDLKPALRAASHDMLHARLALFKQGTLTKPEDMVQLRALKAQIEAAADAQAIALLALKLAARLGAFA